LPATHTFIHEWNEPSCIYSVSIHQMAPPELGSTHPITADYSFIDLERMESWVEQVIAEERDEWKKVRNRWV